MERDNRGKTAEEETRMDLLGVVLRTCKWTDLVWFTVIQKMVTFVVAARRLTA
jgi:hypothetical protein